MSADRYLKVILTIIAIELGWLAIKDAAVPVIAQQREPAPTPVVLRGINLDPARPETLPVTLVGNNAAVPVFSGRPLQLAQPVIVQADRPLPVETGSRPLLIQSVPATSAPLPGPGR